MQQKPDQQVVQIPPQALKVVQAASATLPPVPQRQPGPSVQVAPAESTQVFLCFHGDDAAVSTSKSGNEFERR